MPDKPTETHPQASRLALITPFGGVIADLPATESYTGKEDGKKHYVARTEVPTCSGSRWGTVRITVLSQVPLEAGRYELVVRAYDGNKGEARASVWSRV